MMIAVVGSKWNVSGRSSAQPASDPIPGIAPTISPRIPPARAARIFWNDIATEKPSASIDNVSIVLPPYSHDRRIPVGNGTWSQSEKTPYMMPP